MVIGIPNYIPVVFEGKILGLVSNENSLKFCDNLRNLLKNPTNKSNIFNTMSITLV